MREIIHGDAVRGPGAGGNNPLGGYELVELSIRKTQLQADR